MTWQPDGLVQRFDGDFPEPPDHELAGYGWIPKVVSSGRRGPKPAPIVHGTEHGYGAHYRRGGKPCDECRKARRLADARRRQEARFRPASTHQDTATKGTK